MDPWLRSWLGETRHWSILKAVEASGWQASAVFPARTLVRLPPGARELVWRYGSLLYLHLLEVAARRDTFPDPRPPALREFEALLVELDLLRNALEGETATRAAAALLAATLRGAWEVFHTITGQEPPRAPAEATRLHVRPFALLIAKDTDFLPNLLGMSALLDTVLGSFPGLYEQTDGWAADLVWIRKALREHLANRGLYATLDRQTRHVCRLAEQVADRLQAAIDPLRGPPGYNAPP